MTVPDVAEGPHAGPKIADYAAFVVLMLGGSFLPGFVIGAFVVAVLAIVHIAS